MAGSTVTIRDLRNQGGAVVDRVVAGEHLTVTRGGKAVALLRPVARPAFTAEVLLERWRRLPPVDAARWIEDVDDAVDPSL